MFEYIISDNVKKRFLIVFFFLEKRQYNKNVYSKWVVYNVRDIM